MPLYAPDLATVLTESVRAHTKLVRFRASATVDSVLERRTRVQFDITANGETVLLRVRESATKGRGKSDRTFLFRPNQTIAYDAVANERLVRPVPGGLNRLQRVIYTLGPTDDAVRFLLQPSELAAFYDRLRSIGNWKVQPNRIVRNVKVPGGRNITDLRLDSAKRLTSLSLSSPSSRTNWTIAYLPYRAPALSTPRSAKLVPAFTVAPEPPKYVNAAAENLANSMVRAYQNLRRGTITVREPSGVTTITLDGNRIREDRRSFSYAFDGKTLTMLDPRRRIFYRGTAKRNRIPEYVAASGSLSDSISRQYLLGRIPTRELLVPEMRVRIAGSTVMDGLRCNLLQLDGPRQRVTLVLRADNRLLYAATTTTLDASGRPLTNSVRRYTYTNLGKPPTGAFSLPNRSGYTQRPLPMIKE